MILDNSVNRQLMLMVTHMDAFKRLGRQDKPDALVVVKFFCPWNGWAWYATEAYCVIDGEEAPMTRENVGKAEDIIFFGWVDGDFPELGSFALREMMDIKGPLNLGIERDIAYPVAERSLDKVKEAAA